MLTLPSNSWAVDEILPVDLRIPGCPPTHDAIAAGLLQLLDGADR
jgi:NADH:ubiquinone oxidoreductase subunit B-like Fe-S oxidoreductase